MGFLLEDLEASSENHSLGQDIFLADLFVANNSLLFFDQDGVLSKAYSLNNSE